LNIGDKLSEVEDIVSSSIMLGQYWAKSEAATTAEPLALIAEQSKIKSSKGGVKGGNTRRNRPWRSIAKISIIKERHKNPIFSQNKLATHVLALWADKNINPPTHKVLKKLIYELEHQGVIAKRQPTSAYKSANPLPSKNFDMSRA
jgi:hypothetical protein